MVAALVLGIAAVIVGIAKIAGVWNPFQQTSLPTSSSVNDQRIASAGLDSTKLFTDDSFITVYTLSELNGEQLVDLLEDNGYDYVNTYQEDILEYGWKVAGKRLALIFVNHDGKTTRTEDEVRQLDIGAKNAYGYFAETFLLDAFSTGKEICEACCNVDFIESKVTSAGDFAGYFKKSHGDYSVVVTEINNSGAMLHFLPPSSVDQPNTLEGAKATYYDVLVNYLHTSVDDSSSSNKE